MTRFTVGLVGAGPAAQAIHLPTLARHSDLFEVSAVMDIDPALACAVAAPIGAFHTTSLEELLARGGLDVVVIGSPNQFHATQIEAACAAGVRAILAEKPLVNAHGEIDAVLRALTASGTQLVVGAMHSYDPAWLAAQAAIEGAAGPWHVRCVCFIPGNERFEDAAATMVRPVEAASRSADAGPHPPPPTPAELIRGGVLGLAIHNLPHARVFVPELDGLLAARTVEPWGYTITAQGPA
ncbi:MAG: Gfo/Idh/MocA family oxidoreductase, partial [Bifidobacteriaceae bacterium]|nr:Gfo/Idh/MocA family oxidoreductase [Bifidobacteriaceae bacterium]